ncbi:hypothetical protein COO60DRAFT_55326 [Scenedesmus sp. NREL 46B-D3]|nr:hypothetical protein COO60DRAFT_55326 [Scenedesmus sp. NREL 46B-D3]
MPAQWGLRPKSRTQQQYQQTCIRCRAQAHAQPVMGMFLLACITTHVFYPTSDALPSSHAVGRRRKTPDSCCSTTVVTTQPSPLPRVPHPSVSTKGRHLCCHELRSSTSTVPSAPALCSVYCRCSSKASPRANDTAAPFYTSAPNATAAAVKHMRHQIGHTCTLATSEQSALWLRQAQYGTILQAAAETAAAAAGTPPRPRRHLLTANHAHSGSMDRLCCIRTELH